MNKNVEQKLDRITLLLITITSLLVNESHLQAEEKQELLQVIQTITDEVREG